MNRILALTKKIDLSEIAEGWSGAYIKLSPMLTKDMAKLANRKDRFKTDEEGNLVLDEQGNPVLDVSTEDMTNEMIELLKSKFLSGKVLIEREDESRELVDMEKDDIDALPFEAITRAFQTLVGKDFDPKASQKEAERESEPTNDAPSTEM